MEEYINFAEICGTPLSPPEYSHSSRSQRFYIFPIEVLRLSGAADVLNVVVRQELRHVVEECMGGKVAVRGEVRTYNNRSGVGSRLVITVFAREIEPWEGEDVNKIHLTGAICKEPNCRKTPMGREICDVMTAVNRRYGRADYLPCIIWGRGAREAAGWSVGDMITIEGRIQSRKYIKTTPEGNVEKTAYEVSAITAERAAEEI
jgi:primosomal replication protein N